MSGTLATEDGKELATETDAALAIEDIWIDDDFDQPVMDDNDEGIEPDAA